MKNKTSLKKGVAALFASCLLIGNLAPAIAGGIEGWDWLKYGPVVWEVLKEISAEPGDDGGAIADKVPCWSRAENRTTEFYVDCASCTRQIGAAKGVGYMCTVVRTQ